MLISSLALSSVCKLHVSRWSVCKGSWESPTVVVGKKIVGKISDNICFLIWEKDSKQTTTKNLVNNKLTMDSRVMFLESPCSVSLPQEGRMCSDNLIKTKEKLGKVPMTCAVASPNHRLH